MKFCRDDPRSGQVSSFSRLPPLPALPVAATLSLPPLLPFADRRYRRRALHCLHLRACSRHASLQ